jgi:uncharacterized membrane protein YeaQ/YmgE (transglycosylase-associated protein family)
MAMAAPFSDGFGEWNAHAAKSCLPARRFRPTLAAQEVIPAFGPPHGPIVTRRNRNAGPRLSATSIPAEVACEHSLDHHHRLHRGRDRPPACSGPNNPTGFILTTVLGIVGAFVATFLGQAVGWYRPGESVGLIGATVGALIVLFVWHRLVVSRTIGDPGVSGRP